MARVVSLRRRLLIDLIVSLVVLGAATMGVVALGARTAVARLSRHIIETTLKLTEAELHAFFEPVNETLLILRSYGASGHLDLAEPEHVVEVFLPILAEMEQVSAVMLADETGRELAIFRAGGRWRVRSLDPARPGEVSWTEWTEQNPGPTRRTEPIDYDPRTHPWYVEGDRREREVDVKAKPNRTDHVHWTQPYTFFTLNEPGITAATAFTGPGGRRCVIALDVLLMDVSRFTIAHRPSDNGITFVMTTDARVVGLPCKGGFDSPEACHAAMLKAPDELGVPELAHGLTAHREHIERNNVPRGDPFRFRSGGERWWGGGVHVDIGGGNTLVSAVVIPESDILGDLVYVRYVIIGLTLVVMALAIARAVVVAHRISQPVEALAAESDRIARLQLDASAAIDARFAEVQHLAASQQNMRRALREFMRYMPTELVRELVHLGQAARVGGRPASLTVLFTDIVGFTRLAERADPQQLSDHLAEYFAEVMHVLTVYRGTIDKTMGDAVMAFWGAPKTDAFHAVNAVNAVLACAERLEELNARWSARGLPPLPTCFGLATGRVMVGNVGSPTRLSYTAIGDTVNLASRIEPLNRAYGTVILADESTVAETRGWFHWRVVDRVRVRNKQAAVTLYEPLGRVGEVDADRLTFAETYDRAWRAFQERRFDDASGHLTLLDARSSEHPNVVRLRRLCERMSHRPPAQDWDGVVGELD